MYIKETLDSGGNIESIVQVNRPNWKFDDGSIVTDEYLAKEGYFPVEDTFPQYDSTIEKIERNPVHLWTKDEWLVVDENPEYVNRTNIINVNPTLDENTLEDEFTEESSTINNSISEVEEIEVTEKPNLIKMGKYIVTYNISTLPDDEVANNLYNRLRSEIEAEFTTNINTPLSLVINDKKMSMPLKNDDLLIYTAYRLRASIDSTSNFRFRDTNNNIHILTSNEIIELTNVIDEHVNTVHMTKWTKKDNLHESYNKYKSTGNLKEFMEECDA